MNVVVDFFNVDGGVNGKEVCFVVYDINYFLVEGVVVIERLFM